MNTTEQPLHLTATNDDLYNSEDDRLGSPGLKPMKVNLNPSPSPPPTVPLPQASPDSSLSPEPSGNRKPNRPRHKPSQGDAVLVSFMDNGRQPDIALKAGMQPLASEDEAAEEIMTGGTEVTLAPAGSDLAAIAAGALLAQGLQEMHDSMEQEKPADAQGSAPASDAEHSSAELMEDVEQAIPTTITVSEHAGNHLPESTLKINKQTTVGELPPLQHSSPQLAFPKGNRAGPSLPSISESIGDLNQFPPRSAGPADATVFPQSPPNRSSRDNLPFPTMGRGSPPTSPNDVFASRRELPSPSGGPIHPYYYSHRRTSTAENPQHFNASDYNSVKTEIPCTDNSGATPAEMTLDRMRIDGITNPQIGGHKCTFHGCTAAPFQTLYLLNSHTNVHSSNRPHYCRVQGCPRSEGGKGFKRKNEMIRHGLVHDSPGYVCPFCPDREHKYPRPDNLQRHVRVHHTERDREDPQLREVLAQRPEGPSRGRRCRGGTS
ncbi:hypothetical protein BJ878DRAFT_129113 [Calycina marina]|uniref:C2H2-type domain-containing protein n=1 Tax=Calycina marina TaxID=1763456 RepID=A0A9P7Z9Y7_9HELO|nr:hypothetical protein BJ878DRAFT_129113 [Calycina marina]